MSKQKTAYKHVELSQKMLQKTKFKLWAAQGIKNAR